MDNAPLGTYEQSLTLFSYFGTRFSQTKQNYDTESSFGQDLCSGSTDFYSNKFSPETKLWSKNCHVPGIKKWFTDKKMIPE
jgi:hypothetical protein